MASHLGQSITSHVTLELVGGITGGYGPEQYGWVRILPNGGIQSGPGGGNFVVPTGKALVITDADWQFDDHGTTHKGAYVTLRLFVVPPGADERGRRLLESTIVLSEAGQGGTVTSWTAGGVFGPKTKIGVDTILLSPKGKLQHVLLHGYLIAAKKQTAAKP